MLGISRMLLLFYEILYVILNIILINCQSTLMWIMVGFTLLIRYPYVSLKQCHLLQNLP